MSRFQLLIVDDEIMIRQGLTKLIEKNAGNWEVAGEARNGLEAMAMLEQLNPHLVITDIRMPNMDGIELARTIHERAGDTAVIMLTGYRDFEYAQAALRYGVLDILLKPCPPAEVVRVLDDAYRRIAEKAHETEKKIAEERLSDQHTLRSVMLRLPYDPSRTDRIRSRYLHKELWLMKVRTYFPEGKMYGYNDMGLLQFAVSNIMEELMEEFNLRGSLLQVTYDIFALFIDGDAPSTAFTAELQSTVSRLLGISMQIQCAGRAERLGQLPDFIDQLSGANDGVMGTVTDRQAVDSGKIRSIQNDIMSKIMLGQADKVKQQIEAHLASVRALSVEELKSEALTLALSLHEIMKKEFAAGDDAHLGKQLERLQNSAAASEALRWMEEQMALFLAEFHRWMNSHNQNIIEKAISYIEDHYMNDCDLKEVADYVHLSANYFSNMFKKETGESFVNYVMKIRIDRAKVLISNTEMKVFEIAQRVGYDDPNYFTTVFRQLTGMSPKQYRKQVREQTEQA